MSPKKISRQNADKAIRPKKLAFFSLGQSGKDFMNAWGHDKNNTFLQGRAATSHKLPCHAHTSHIIHTQTHTHTNKHTQTHTGSAGAGGGGQGGALQGVEVPVEEVKTRHALALPPSDGVTKEAWDLLHY
eukprot:1145423-Pelagomonas_calceolata.AAC.4